MTISDSFRLKYIDSFWKTVHLKYCKTNRDFELQLKYLLVFSPLAV